MTRAKTRPRPCPMPRARILVAMSGGVDSSVAAGLLCEQGHDVVGVTLHLWDAQGEAKVGRCCAPEDREDARRSADHLGIPHYVVDERASFREHVVEPFIEAYQSGSTPSPCVHCNRTVKLGFLMNLADRFGCERVATGHYARIGPTGALLRGRDRHKDQSYFLWGVPVSARRRLVFPLGELVKDEARDAGRRLGLPNADKPDSQELCFVPDGDVRGFIARERGEPEGGLIRDASTGEVLAEHDGIERFTIGQRRGLRVGGGPPRYVLRIVPEEREVWVGSSDRLLAREARVRQIAWVATPTHEPFRAEVRVRYRHEPAPAWVTPSEEGLHAQFDEPQRAVTPGQAAVVYRGDEVLAGGFVA